MRLVDCATDDDICSDDSLSHIGSSQIAGLAILFLMSSVFSLSNMTAITSLSTLPWTC